MKIKVNNKEFFFFNNFAVTRRLDAVASVFSVVGKFNPDNTQHVELFRPSEYQKIEVLTDTDVLLLTGKIVKYDFNSKDNPELVKISGYSLPGELEDCNIPYSAYPLESNNRSLKEIAEKLLDPFGLSLIIDSSVSNEVNLNYSKSVATATEPIKQYLAKLAAQRNVVLSHNEKGQVVLFRPNVKARPVLSLDTTNSTRMSLSFDGQKLHSDITVLRQPSPTNVRLTPVDTIKNPYTNSFRPKVRVMSSGTDTDTSRAADNVLAAELKAITVNVVLPRFEDVKPGDIIEVQNREIFLYNKTRFMLSAYTINENESKLTMTLSLTIPEAFTGGEFKNIFQ